MKKQLLIILITLLSVPTFSQNNVMNKGDIIMNAGVGFGSPQYNDYSYGNNFGFGIMPSLNVSGEIGLFPTGEVGIVTLGGIVSAGSSKFKGFYYDGKAFSLEVLFRGAWHLSIWNNPDWDVYAGIGTGIRYNTIKYTSHGSVDLPNNNGTNFIISEFIGARYMMKENFGFFGEFANGEVSFTKIGVTFKF